MKNLNKKITIFLTLLASISIAGCSNTNTGGGSKEPTYDINDFSKIETLQKAMYYIAKEKNYTMKYSGKFLVDHEFLFTKYSIGVISDVYPEMDKSIIVMTLKVFTRLGLMEKNLFQVNILMDLKKFGTTRSFIRCME